LELKRGLCAVLSAVLLFALPACGGGEPPEPEPTPFPAISLGDQFHTNIKDTSSQAYVYCRVSVVPYFEEDSALLAANIDILRDIVLSTLRHMDFLTLNASNATDTLSDEFTRRTQEFFGIDQMTFLFAEYYTRGVPPSPSGEPSPSGADSPLGSEDVP
jgi:flagellar basal body-associated protein FliL